MRRLLVLLLALALALPTLGLGTTHADNPAKRVTYQVCGLDQWWMTWSSPGVGLRPAAGQIPAFPDDSHLVGRPFVDDNGCLNFVTQHWSNPDGPTTRTLNLEIMEPVATIQTPRVHIEQVKVRRR